MKKNPVYTAILHHKDADPNNTIELPFNQDQHEDMSKSEIESHCKSKFPNLVFKGFR